jgi:hypothetical protein
MRCLQRPQSLLVGDARGAVDIGSALKDTKHQRRANRRGLDLAMKELAVASMQKPFFFAANGDAAMSGRVARQRDHQNIPFAVA